MKILYIPLDFHRHAESPELFTDLVNALGGEIYQSKEQAIAYKPDVILFHGGLSPDDLRILKNELNAPVFMWTGDCRYIPQESLMMYRDVADAYCLPFSGEYKDRYQRILGKPCYFLWEPIQNWRFKHPKELKEGPVTFAGNLYDSLPGGETRPEMLSFLNIHLRELKIYGSFPGCSTIDNGRLPEIYNNSYVVIAENNIHDIPAYFTPRNIGAMASGSCVVMRWFPGIEEFFIDGVDCFVYKHKYELLDIILFLQKNTKIRHEIAIGGNKEALRSYTPEMFALRFKDIYEIRSSNS